MSSFSGLLNLNKPSGVTSRDVVDQVVRLLPRKTKVGHAGTLDPLASGVLVVAVGSATRLIEYVQRQQKTYHTTLRLGSRSDTLDADGQITEVENPRIPSESEIRSALETQVGTIQQVPPQFSAVRVSGRRAYDLARAGQDVDLSARAVKIDRIDLLSYAWPFLELEIDCGGGTYIRSIARDLGDSLGCGALVTVLTRTRIGAFLLSDAIDPSSLAPESIPRLMRPPAMAVADLPRLDLSPDQVARILRGQPLDVRVAPGELALFGPDDTLVAIGESRSGQVWPRRVLGM
jgi:tRNA pseudouridine55 synthase